jgi:hypothetical protein
MKLKVKSGNTINKKPLVRYFPLILFVACIILECIFQVVPLLGGIRGLALFYIWPFGLLIWLIYWVCLHPRAILNFSYLVLVNVFLIFAHAVTTPKISRLLGIPSLTDHVSFVLPIVFIVLLIIQLAAKEIVRSKRRL